MTIPRVPTGGADNSGTRSRVANTINTVATQLETAQSDITTLQGSLGALGGDLTGTLPNPTVAANKIDNTKLAQMGANTIKGNATGSTANAADLTADQVKALLGSTLAQAPVISETGAVATGTGTMPGVSDTAPTSSQGNQYLSATITPKNASSTLIIDITVVLAGSAVGFLQAALFQDSGTSALASTIGNPASTTIPIILHFRHKMVAGTTSPTTFKVRAGLDRSGTTTFNGSAGTRIGGGTMASSITVTEYLP